MFRNLKKFLEVALENLQGGESINIKQSIAENATSDRGITINNPTQIVNVPDEESKLKNADLNDWVNCDDTLKAFLERDTANEG